MLHVEIYNPNINSVKAGNIGSWANANKLDGIIELHRNAVDNPQAHGYETILDYKNINSFAKNVHAKMVALGWRDRGYKYANDGKWRNLSNPRKAREARQGGIPYALLELGFIGNSNDNKIFDQNLVQMGNLIMKAAIESGMKRIGIVYGHGGGDPGAGGLGRREATDVRKIPFNPSNLNSKPQSTPSESTPNNPETAIKKEAETMTKVEIEQLIDSKLKEFQSNLVNGPEIEDSWVNEDFNALNKFLECRGVEPITSKQHNTVVTRAILIRVAKLLADAMVSEKRER